VIGECYVMAWQPQSIVRLVLASAFSRKIRIVLVTEAIR